MPVHLHLRKESWASRPATSWLCSPAYFPSTPWLRALILIKEPHFTQSSDGHSRCSKDVLQGRSGRTPKATWNRTRLLLPTEPPAHAFSQPPLHESQSSRPREPRAKPPGHPSSPLLLWATFSAVPSRTIQGPALLPPSVAHRAKLSRTRDRLPREDGPSPVACLARRRVSRGGTSAVRVSLSAVFPRPDRRRGEAP